MKNWGPWDSWEHVFFYLSVIAYYCPSHWMKISTHNKLNDVIIKKFFMWTVDKIA